MKKIFLLLVAGFLFNVHVQAQSVKYTEHVLAQGETLSMLAEKYKTTVGDIMRLNNMHAGTKLNIGQKLKIPSTGQTVVRPGEKTQAAATPKPAAPAGITVSGAVTHTVQPKETMYAISKKYGVSIDQLKQWNSLADNSLEIGQVIAVSEKGIEEAAAKRKESEAAKAIAAVPVQTPPVVTNEIIKEEQPVQNTVQEVNDTVKQEGAAATGSAVIPAAAPQATTQTAPAGIAAADGSDNFFAKNFEENAVSKAALNAQGTAMIFKTASGWSDKKYYILMNDAPSGSFVKISSSNGNTVYAKVLWKLDDMKENKGLQFRVSEAAAAALNVQGDKFPLSIQYYQ